MIAQAELRRLAAFKMPEDKVACVNRVSTTIMNLLSLAADKSVPAADDFMPVLVFVSCPLQYRKANFQNTIFH